MQIYHDFIELSRRLPCSNFSLLFLDYNAVQKVDPKFGSNSAPRSFASFNLQ